MPPEMNPPVRLSTSDEPHETKNDTHLEFHREEKPGDIQKQERVDNRKSSCSVAALNASLGQFDNAQSEHPVKPIRMLTEAQVCARTTLKRSTVRRLIKANRFPHSVPILKGRIAWYGHEIDEWLWSRPRSKKGLIMKGIKVTGPVQMLTAKEVEKKISLSHSTLYRGMDADSLPASVRLSKGRIAWYEHELNAWLAALRAPKPPVVTI